MLLFWQFKIFLHIVQGIKLDLDFTIPKNQCTYGSIENELWLLSHQMDYIDPFLGKGQIFYCFDGNWLWWQKVQAYKLISSPPLALQVPILLECMENLSILHKFLLFYNFLQKIVIFPPFPKIAFLLSKENSVPILQNIMALFWTLHFVGRKGLSKDEGGLRTKECIFSTDIFTKDVLWCFLLSIFC